MAVVSDTSSRPQNCVGNCSGLCIRWPPMQVEVPTGDKTGKKCAVHPVDDMNASSHR